MGQDWLQLEFPLGEHDAERVTALLESLDALAVTLADAADDPIYEPPPGATPLWQSTRVTALFDPRVDRAALLAALAGALPGFAAHRLTELADREWAREWLAHFQPMRFGRRLWVVPTAYQPPEPGAVNLILDPGLAFGTGSHPTTALCLEWLDAHADALRGARVLDFGCGSGILAIAAALLGAERVAALDIDPQALDATRENAARNGVLDRLEVGGPDALSAAGVGRPFGALVANILANPLRELAPTLMAALPAGAPFALSGILADQADEVGAAYAPYATLAAPVQRGDWVRLDGVRTDARR
jgi:ribosomal protein L11 methyltransferase